MLSIPAATGSLLADAGRAPPLNNIRCLTNHQREAVMKTGRRADLCFTTGEQIIFDVPAVRASL